MKTIVCIGTGPSLTDEQIEIARSKGYTLFGCNLVYAKVPDLALLYAVNIEFWRHYWNDRDFPLKDYPAEKWTTNREAADKFGLRWVDEVNRPGLSTDHSYVHHGHGSGYTLVNLAAWRADRIILIGYDLKYAPDYDGRARQIGSAKRHYFGEYPDEMQHWPSVSVKNGIHEELVELYRSVAKQGFVEIINCTPGSAIDAFPMENIADL